MNERTLFAARDPQGFRPLVLGQLAPGWAVASETAALEIVGASFVREIEPGELITIDERGVRSRTFAPRRAAGLPVRVRLPGPPGHHHRGPQRAGHPGRGRPSAGGRVPGRRRPGHPGARVRHARGHRLRRGQRHPLRAGPGQELLRGPDVHPAQPDHPAARHPAQAEPAERGDRREAAGGGGRLDRARQHPAGHRGHAARGGRGRGARPDLQPAGQLALLLRHRLRHPGRADRRARLGRGDLRVHRGRLARLHLAGGPDRRDHDARRTGCAGPASTATTRSRSPTPSRASTSGRTARPLQVVARPDW